MDPSHFQALATSADEHAKLLAAKQAQEMLLVEHLTNLNISSESKGTIHSNFISTDEIVLKIK